MVGGILVGEFEGLTAKDFDVYAESRWSSNVHNLDRMRTKERVLVLARRMREAASDLRLGLDASQETPGIWNNRQVRDQWAYLLREADDRKTVETLVAADLDLATKVHDAAPHHRHLLLCVRLDHDGVELGLRAHRLARVDLANLVGRAAQEPSALEALLAALPDDVRLDGRRATADALLAAARSTLAGEAEWLSLGRRLDRAAAIGLAAGLGAVAATVAEALLPLFRFVAWRPDNDYVGVGRRLDELASARQREAEAQRERDAREREARERAAAQQAERDEWRRLQAQRRARAFEESAPSRRPAPSGEGPAAPGEGPAPTPEAPADEDRGNRWTGEAPRPEADDDRGNRRPAGEAPAERRGGGPDRLPGDSDRRRGGPDRLPGDSDRRRGGPDRPAGGPERRGGGPERPQRGPRPEGERPQRGPRPEGERPQRGPRPEGDRPQRGPRPEGERPQRAPWPAGEPPTRSARPSASPRDTEAARRETDAPRPTEKPRPIEDFAAGDACLLTRGLFAGKEGVVTARDPKGDYKVKVGNLEVRVAPADLRRPG